MSLITKLQSTGKVSWCPKGTCIVKGTATNTIGADFDDSSYLEFYQISSEPKLFKKINSPFKFNEIKWIEYENYEKGILICLTDKKTINFYDAKKVIEMKEENELENQIIFTAEMSEEMTHIDYDKIHKICGVCGLNGNCSLFDCTNIENITEMKINQKSDNEILKIKINQKFPHIIALLLSSGVISIFDTKKKKIIINLKQLDNLKWKGMEWIPYEKTMLITYNEQGNEQDKNLFIWDVTKIASPVKVLNGHKKEIKALVFNGEHFDRILTVSDECILIFEKEKYEIIERIQLEECENISQIECSCLEGRFFINHENGIQFHTISDFADGKQPQWMKRTAGIAFGFGGKIVTFNGKQIEMKKNVGKVEIKTMEKGEIEELCVKKSEHTEGEEQETWKLISGMVCKDENAVINITGYEKEKMNEMIEQFYIEKGLKEEVKEVEKEEVKEEKKNEDDEDFDPFDNLEASDEDEDPFKDTLENEEEEKKEEEIVEIEPTDEEVILEKIMITGNIEKAVDFCLKTKRYVDALILTQNNKEMYDKIIEQYKKEQWNKKVFRTIEALMNNKLEEIVESGDLNDWKYLLYVISINANATMRPVLIVRLADRLFAKNNKHAALICYIASGNVSKLIDLWVDSTKKIEEIVERIEILKQMCGQVELNENIVNKIVEQATQLASIGELTAAQKLIECLGKQQNEKTIELQNRIYYSQGCVGPKPVCPYKIVSVGAQVQQKQEMKQQRQPMMQPRIPTGQPAMPTMPKPPMPGMPQQQPVAHPPMNTPMMPTIPKPTMPTMPQQPVAQPAMPKPPMPTMPQQPVAQPPMMPTMPKPTMPTMPQQPVVQPPVNTPMMPAMPKPQMPTMPQQPVAQPPMMPTMPKPQMPAMPQQPVAQPPVNTPMMPAMPKPTMPTMPQQPVAQPAMPKPQMPAMPHQPVSQSPKLAKPQPVVPKAAMPKPTSSVVDATVDPTLCNTLKQKFDEVINMIETKAKGTSHERTLPNALKKAQAFAQVIEKIPAEYCNQFIEIFNDILKGDITEADKSFKKILTNKQVSQFVPSGNLVGVKYIVDSAKQLK